MGTVRDPITLSGVSFNTEFGKVIDVMEGWEGTPGVDVAIVANGGGAGALFGTTPVVKERYLAVGGAWATSSREDAEAARNALLNLLPLGQEIVLERYGRRAYAWVYDQVEVDLVTPRGFRWSAALVCLDPLRYLPAALGGSAAPYTGVDAYRTYSSNTRTYTTNARTYQVPAGAANEVRVVNAGGATSRRVTFTVAGPMATRDWRVQNATTGEAVYVNTSLGAGQSVTFDAAQETATQNGADVTYAMYGTIPGLAPGENVFRLTTADPNAAGLLTVTAYAAER